MNLIDTLNWRYSTKEFDPNKKIPPEDIIQLKELLRLSASSTNIQPWHFILTETDEGKKRIAKGTQGLFQFNEKKVLDASNVVLFCSRTSADEEYMKHLLAQEDNDGRYPNEDVKQMMFNGRNMFADMHRYDFKDFQHWLEKQVYLNIGSFLLGAATLKIDALPMEGIDLKILDEEFGLREKELTSVVAVALGYRTETDFNSKTAKSRFSEKETFTFI